MVRLINDQAGAFLLGAKRLFRFLEGRDVLGDALPGLRTRDPEATFAWTGENGSLDCFYEKPIEEEIGIIQGGALSCLLANLVLHFADLKLTLAMAGRQYCYLRYCDDMILIATSEADCQRGLDAYREALDLMRLPAHEPDRTVPYGRRFWRQKSKGPYRWSRRLEGVPWIGFVGYQIHQDGHIRIRPASIRKQIQTMRRG